MLNIQIPTKKQATIKVSVTVTCLHNNCTDVALHGSLRVKPTEEPV